MHVGYDISRFQDGSGPRSAIDYHAAAEGLRWISSPDLPFVIINLDDPYYAQDRAGFEAEGIPVRAYYFANVNANPREEALRVRAIVGLEPVALDLETEAPGGWGPTAQWTVDFFSWPSENNDLVYGNENFRFNVPGWAWGHEVWFAGTSLPAGLSPVLWQFGTRFNMPGIPGNVDVNKWLGTEDQFRAFFGLPAPVVPKAPGLFERFRNWLPWFHH